MARTLTIDILFDSLQVAVEQNLIEEWSVAGRRVVFQRNGQTFSLPALEARDYLRRLFREREMTESEKGAAVNTVVDKGHSKYVIEGLLNDDLGLNDFKSLVNLAVRDLVKTKSMRLRRVHRNMMA